MTILESGSPEELFMEPRTDLIRALTQARACSDALFVGLPVVSLYGPTFAARVAVSLLHAAGVGELATDSLENYHACALHLAQNRHELKQLRAKLVENRSRCALFDTARFTRDLEQAYRRMLVFHREGLPPRAFAVEASA